MSPIKFSIGGFIAVQRLYRTSLAAIVSPSAPAVLLAVATQIGMTVHEPSLAFIEWLYLSAAIVGTPTFVLLRWLGRNEIHFYIFAAFAAGTASILLLAFPVFLLNGADLSEALAVLLQANARAGVIAIAAVAIGNGVLFVLVGTLFWLFARPDRP